jgi:uncharacterized repeat protein (TIGR01451 family)
MRVRGSGLRGPSGHWARGATVLGVVLALAGTSAGPVLADTTIGQTGAMIGCPSQFTGTFADLSPAYQVPAGGGTITSFSFQSGPGNAGQKLDFLLVRPAGGSNYTVVGRTGIVVLATNSALETFAANIPAQAGDLLGMWEIGISNCRRPGGSAVLELSTPDPAVGATVSLPNLALFDFNESAHLVQAADLSLAKSAAPSSVQHNQNVAYALTVTNNGPDTAVAPMLVDTLPVGQVFLSSSAGCTGSSGSPVVVTCALADLPPGPSSVTVTIVARAGSVGAGLTDRASVSSVTPDSNAANNSASASVDVVASADLSLTKSSSPNPAIAGQQVTYALTAANAGPDAALAPVIVDRLPAGSTFQGASSGCTFDPGTGPAGTVTCTLADLAAGGSATVQVVVLAPAGSLVNSATVSSATADPDATNNGAAAATTVNSSCTDTRTGRLVGSIVVHAGQFLCLVDANLVGSVIVDAGGALSVINATISGGVDSSGARFVTLCGSTFGGAVIVKNTSLLVRVGDDDSGCAPDHLNGSLSVTGGHGGVEVFGNTIGGPVSITNNRGASPLADGSPEVEGNTVGGALTCSGDIPPATNDGAPNTAAGAKLGECAAL